MYILYLQKLIQMKIFLRSLLKNHLFGEESDWKIHDESRKPSSTNAHDAFKDSEYDRKKAVEKKQVQKTVEAIKNLE